MSFWSAFYSPAYLQQGDESRAKEEQKAYNRWREPKTQVLTVGVLPSKTITNIDNRAPKSKWEHVHKEVGNIDETVTDWICQQPRKMPLQEMKTRAIQIPGMITWEVLECQSQEDLLLLVAGPYFVNVKQKAELVQATAKVPTPRPTSTIPFPKRRSRTTTSSDP